MRILITGIEIAGWVNAYKDGFEKNGHKVTTALFGEDRFYKKGCDLQLKDPIDFKFSLRFNAIYLIVSFLRSIYMHNMHRQKVKKLINEHDVVVYIWRPLIKNFSDFKYVKKKKKKLVCLFVGSDVRYSNCFIQEFQITNQAYLNDSKGDSLEMHLPLVRNAEKYADLIYSVPDQSGLQLRPYYHLQVPLSVEKLRQPVEKPDQVITVLHAPSKPSVKGTDVIENAVYRLIDEGYRIKFISIRNMMNHEVIEMLAKSDILVDELVAHGPGALSFEAMGCGCVVATKHIESSPSCFKPPVIAIDESNVYDKLKALITDSTMRKQLSQSGLEYSRKNNNVYKITEDIIKDLSSNRKCDYHPQFLRNNYRPVSVDEISEINKWNNYVRNCEWYKTSVVPGIRDGLIF